MKIYMYKLLYLKSNVFSTGVLHVHVIRDHVKYKYIYLIRHFVV